MDDLCNDKPSDNGITRHPEIPAPFPKGFNGFYCMKYEISQQQYAVFLNKLSFIEQQTRMANNAFDPVGTLVMTTAGYQNRNGIRIKQTSGGAPAIVDVDLNGDGAYGDGNSIACNYMSWSDLLAYLDWAALRPMTELEYEKAARGPLEPILTEFVWGNTSILQAKSDELLNPGTDSEISNTSGDGLCAHGTGPSETLGPLRTGFAATATTIRTTSGASYWGIMDLSGNLQEQTISIGFLDNGVRPPISHIFIGENGDGMLDEDGNSNISTWPSANTVGAVIRRGGDWQSSSQRAQTSDRAFVNITLTERSSQVGGRGVRTP
jgi:formylglycine-generating enzyme required for sulfatase activity